MRDYLITFGLIAAVCLGVFLAMHIFVCVRADVNWFSAPFMNAMSYNAGSVNGIAFNGDAVWTV